MGSVRLVTRAAVTGARASPDAWQKASTLPMLIGTPDTCPMTAEVCRRLRRNRPPSLATVVCTREPAVMRGRGVSGHRPLVLHARSGVDGGHATAQASLAGAGVGRGCRGTGHGLGPREGRAPVQGHQVAAWPRDGAVPGTGE